MGSGKIDHSDGAEARDAEGDARLRMIEHCLEFELEWEMVCR